MANVRVTQALIYAELQAVRQTLEVHTRADENNFRELRQLLEGTDAAPGFKIRVDRIEQSAGARYRHFGYIWAAILTALGAALSAFISR